MGYGASLMLLGWALRTFGPHLKYSQTPQHDDPNFLVEQRLWVRFVQGLGGVVAIAGTTMVLMTFVVVLVNPNDETGMIIAWAIWGFILAVVLIWCGMYLSRFGLTGIWSREHGYGFRSTRKGAVVARRSAPAEPESAHPTDEMLVTIDDHAVDPEVEMQSVDVAGDELAMFTNDDGLVADSIDAESLQADPLAETDPDEAVYDFGDSSDTTVPKDVGGRAEALRRLRQRQSRASQSSSS
jgi:hypothetical protein